MEIKKLHPFVIMLVLVGIIVGMGVLILDSFSDATFRSTTIANESFTYPALNATVSLANANITSFTQVLNASGDAVNESNYNVVLAAGTLNNTLNSTTCVGGQTCFAYYVYNDYNTVSATALDSARDAVSGIATSWMALIVTIAILAIILLLVIRSFGAHRR